MGNAVYLSLGSNLGDSASMLTQALEELDRLPGTRVKRASRLYETEPVGELNQPAFLNIAAEIETVLSPLELLNAAQRIERELGREKGPRWGPRLIDIDLILWGETVMQDEDLTLPHPRFRTRAFVLAPLSEIAPDVRDPITGQTVRQLSQSPGIEGQVLPLT
jgi:2-amino-4-hydroxy-6-hydroxymethyldihydropteridine diphosphokinase